MCYQDKKEDEAKSGEDMQGSDVEGSDEEGEEGEEEGEEDEGEEDEDEEEEEEDDGEPKVYEAGDRVMGRWKGSSEFHPGKVVKRNADGTCHVEVCDCVRACVSSTQCFGRRKMGSISCM